MTKAEKKKMLSLYIGEMWLIKRFDRGKKKNDDNRKLHEVFNKGLEHGMTALVTEMIPGIDLYAVDVEIAGHANDEVFTDRDRLDLIERCLP